HLMAINSIKGLSPALGPLYTHLIAICKVHNPPPLQQGLSRANVGAVAHSDQEDLVKKAESAKGVAKSENKVEQLKDAVKDRKVFMRSYKSKPDDTEWAYKGVVATVINGESLSVVQNRIMDAGFIDLILIPMGADK
ncbi:putative sulfate transporter, partial [Trifolium pratense]